MVDYLESRSPTPVTCLEWNPACMQRIPRLLFMLLALVGSTVRAVAGDAPDLRSTVTAVLAEAQGLGLPKLDGATLYEGALTLGDESEIQRRAARSLRHVQAKLPDGSWLVDLVESRPENVLDANELAALKPFVPGSPAPALASTVRYAGVEPDILAQARRIAVGVPEAMEGFPPIPERDWDAAFYPRQDRSRDPAVAVRLACRSWFLSHGQIEPAVAIVPEVWRADTRRRAQHPVAAQPLPSGALGTVASYRFPTTGRAPIVDESLLPGMDDDALVAMTDDRTVAVTGCTAGEIALYALGERWGLDPALMAGRDPVAPWDDAEQTAVATGLAAWWKRTVGDDLPTRWLEVLGTLPYERAQAALLHRASVLEVRRYNVTDRLRNHTWQGDVPPVAPPDDGPELLYRLAALTLTRWDERGITPGDPSPTGLQNLMRILDPDAVSSATGQIAEARMGQVSALRQRFATLAAKWPRSGPLAEALLVWDDQQGHPDGLNALVAARLAAPGLTFADRVAALRHWVRRINAERWGRLDGVLVRDPADPDWQALAALAQVPYGHDYPYQSDDSSQLILWRLLNDPRPLPANVDAQVLLPAPGGRIADAVAGRLAARLASEDTMFWAPLDVDPADAALIRAAGRPGIVSTTGTAGSGTAAIATSFPSSAASATSAAAATALSRAYAPLATYILRSHHLPLPHDLETDSTTAAPAPIVVAVPAAPPGLTPEEESDVRKALGEAQALGFPDLTGAQTLLGDFPGGGHEGWWGIQIRLADGSWLAQEVHAVASADPGAKPDWVLPLTDGGGLMQTQQLPATVRARVGNSNLGRLEDASGDAVLPALAWWLSGVDAQGKGVVAAVLREAALRRDLYDIWSIGVGRGGSERGPVATVSTIGDGVRRSLARWFRAQLVWDADGAKADRTVAAIWKVLPAADAQDWRPLVERLRARLDLPMHASPKAGLDVRLQSWLDANADAHGHWRDEAEVPATRAATAELVALLSDDRATRWVDRFYALPHPLGDAALEALGRIWGVDWRWIVASDPTVAALLPPPTRDQPPVFPGMGDEWLWVQSAWTPERRAAVVTALQAWWRNHGAAGASPLAAIFQGLPVNQWAEVLTQLAPADTGDQLGDAIAQRLRALPPPDPEQAMGMYTVQAILVAGMRFPTHAGISAALAAWPPSPWLTGVAAIRAECAGDSAAFDRWIQAGLARGGPPKDQPGEESGALMATVWGAIGLWAHDPSAERLAALRQLLARDPSDATMTWLLLQVGSSDWLNGLDAHRRIGSDTAGAIAQAIPCALAVDGLKDRRPLDEKARARLRSRMLWVEIARVLDKLPNDARVCDWVAARLMIWGSVLGKAAHGDALTFLASPLAQRDVVIAGLVDQLKPQAEDDEVAAGLLPKPPNPANTPNF
jgi:hypothetical protein